MLNVSDGFRAAVVGLSRQMLARAVVEIVDPDITYGTSNGSGIAPWAKPEQLHDKEYALDSRYATLEPGRWPLDGSCRLIPDDPTQLAGEIAHVGDVLCDAAGVFAGEVYAEQPFENVSILQACSVFFSTDAIDGIPVDFRVSVMQGETAVFTKEFTGNTATSVAVTDFTVYDPTSIRVYVTRWSIGRRRIRVAEIIPGLYESWGLDQIVSLGIDMRGNFAGLALPYNTCRLRLRNTDRRFEPYTRTGIFKSIEERQAIPISLGPKLPDGRVEYASVGVYFQKSGGWDTGKNDMYIDWDLVDICGLLADRDFIVPDELPTTLGGWFACFVAQLGKNFERWYHVDPAYENLPLTIADRKHLQNRKVGAMIRYACMATGTWPRADQETGYLTAEPLWSQGSKLTLQQIYDYPTKKGNDALSELIFKVYDVSGSDTTYVVSGNASASARNLSIDNPFIHTQAQALTAARQILSQYGGIVMKVTGRGDPATEIGDVDTVWINRSEARTGRRMAQSFRLVGGVLKNCGAELLQADGSYLYENSVVLTGEGTWTPPVENLRVVIGQGGQGGMRGQDGWVRKAHNESFDLYVDSGFGAQGENGTGGKIWHGAVSVNPDVPISFKCGKGGKASDTYGVSGAMGEESTFGVYSSAGGSVYPNGYTDIINGLCYGRTAVPLPLDGTGDGAQGGKGGTAGAGELKKVLIGYSPSGTPWYSTELFVDAYPGPGKMGKDGADGFVLIFWDKEDET